MTRPAFLLAAALAACLPARAAGMDHGDDPTPTLFNAIRVELDGETSGDSRFSWDVDGWIGGDAERVWIRSEGALENGDVEDAELQLYYGWNVDTYWDALIGLRQDFEPEGRTYLAASLVGLAPYFFETEASLFLSDRGDLTARLHQSVDLLLTNRLIAEPYAELNLAAEDVPDLHLGAGFTDVQLGLQLRYEVSRRFAPYVEAVWERKLGETSGIARRLGEDPEHASLRIGIRLLF